MLYGKQVVVTGYSGTNNFCNISCAWIANYDLVKVPNGRFVYPVPDALWAEVDIRSLATCMQNALKSIENRDDSASGTKEKGKRKNQDKVNQFDSDIFPIENSARDILNGLD